MAPLQGAGRLLLAYELQALHPFGGPGLFWIFLSNGRWTPLGPSAFDTHGTHNAGTPTGCNVCNQ